MPHSTKSVSTNINMWNIVVAPLGQKSENTYQHVIIQLGLIESTYFALLHTIKISTEMTQHKGTVFQTKSGLQYGTFLIVNGKQRVLICTHFFHNIFSIPYLKHTRMIKTKGVNIDSYMLGEIFL